MEAYHAEHHIRVEGKDQVFLHITWRKSSLSPASTAGLVRIIFLPPCPSGPHARAIDVYVLPVPAGPSAIIRSFGL